MLEIGKFKVTFGHIAKKKIPKRQRTTFTESFIIKLTPL